MLSHVAAAVLTILSNLAPAGDLIALAERMVADPSDALAHTDAPQMAAVQLELLPDPEGAERLATQLEQRLADHALPVFVELIPGEKMVVRAYDYYESDVVRHGSSARKAAYMIRGVCGAFMDLAYGGEYDPTGKTGLNTFHCEQTKGIECGDEYGEFVVTRAA